jgi:hypothetical protein
LTREPSRLTTEELVNRVRAYTARYSANRHRGQLFRTYADHVQELLDRLDPATEAMHVEYAPVFPNGMVIDQMAVSEPTTLDDRLPTASRLVTPWRTDEPVVQ